MLPAPLLPSSPLPPRKWPHRRSASFKPLRRKPSSPISPPPPLPPLLSAHTRTTTLQQPQLLWLRNPTRNARDYPLIPIYVPSRRKSQHQTRIRIPIDRLWRKLSEKKVYLSFFWNSHLLFEGLHGIYRVGIMDNELHMLNDLLWSMDPRAQSFFLFFFFLLLLLLLLPHLLPCFCSLSPPNTKNLTPIKRENKIKEQRELEISKMLDVSCRLFKICSERDCFSRGPGQRVCLIFCCIFLKNPKGIGRGGETNGVMLRTNGAKIHGRGNKGKEGRKEERDRQQTPPHHLEPPVLGERWRKGRKGGLDQRRRVKNKTQNKHAKSDAM